MVQCPSYDLAHSVLGSFLPLTLEQLAREHGTLQTSHLPCWGPDSPPKNGTQSDEQCMVGVMGLQINTASFAMYTFSLAVLIQALTLISFSALADYGREIGRHTARHATQANPRLHCHQRETGKCCC